MVWTGVVFWQTVDYSHKHHQLVLVMLAGGKKKKSGPSCQLPVLEVHHSWIWVIDCAGSAGRTGEGRKSRWCRWRRVKSWKSSRSLSSARAPRWSPIISQRMQELQTQKNKLIMSNRAGVSLNKSPRDAELLDQGDVSRTRLSYMMDGLIIRVFSIDSFKI